jgi:alkylation response protein AidB-like acyl-CoA dehydrogenase
MDFGWQEPQRELYERVLAFAREKLGRDAAERDRERRFPVEDWRRCGEFGLLGLSVPERYRGLGLDALTTARAIEAFGRGCADMGLVFSAAAHLFAGVMPILLHGGERFRERVLPRLATGECVGANAITEAEAGSDAFALKTSAVRDGDRYVLNGAKTFVTNGPVADVIVVYASTNPAHGHLGVSAFAVEKGTPGLLVGQPFEKMGLRSSPISSLYFEDCRVPAESLLGAEGAGAAVFSDSMRWERSCLFAAYVGSMERQLEGTIAYAAERRQFRKPIGKNQAISHRIVDMKLRLEAARLLLYRACWLGDRGEDSAIEVSLAKLAVSEAAIASGLDAIHIHGGLGFMTESGVERSLRDAVPATLFSGTSEIQRDVVARRLGL